MITTRSTVRRFRLSMAGPLAIIALSCGPAAADRTSVHSPASSPALGSDAGCYLLALGPAAESRASAQVVIPSALELRADGHVAGAAADTDRLVVPEPDMFNQWTRRASDSVLVGWSPNWLGGSLKLRLVRRADTLAGRYELHHHEIDDGRLLWRGNAKALRIRCSDEDGARGRRLAGGQTLVSAERALAEWRFAQQPDTATATAEALRAFEAFLLRTPVHSLSLLNYRIAEYACWHGRLPETLGGLRAAERHASTVALERLAARSWLDAWGRPLLYRRRGAHGYEVRSAGPDGTAGTADDLVGAYDEVPLKRERKDNCQ